MSAGESDGSPELALRLHWLFEAHRLEQLPRPLAAAVARLAAAAEQNTDARRPWDEVRRLFLDFREQLGLDGLPWPETESGAWKEAARVLARCEGEATPCRAAERLGRFCEELLHSGRGGKSSGSYYTPAWAAEAISDTVLRGVLEGRGPKAAAASLRVLDPAVGAGAFAVAAVETIARAAGEGEGQNAIRRAAASECVFGMEVDPLAAETCRMALWLAASRPGRPAAVPKRQVLVGDGLREQPGFEALDAVVGNPPWGVKLAAERARALAKGAAGALSGHRDSYLFFLHRALHYAREDGGIGMVLPDALLWQVRYEGMRRAVLDRFRPLRVLLLGDRIFPGATAPACALCLAGRKIAPGTYSMADLRRVRRARLSNAVAAPGWRAESEAPLSAAHTSFLVPPGWLRALLAKMGQRHPTLGELGHVFKFHDVGINYGRAQAGRAILYEGEQQGPSDIPVTRGRDFGALTDVGHSSWLRRDWAARVGREDRVVVRDCIYRWRPKLLLRQTGDRPVATVDRRGVWFGRSVISVTASTEHDLLWLAAVLSSGAFAALYRAMAPEAGRPFAQVKVGKLKAVPVPWPPRCDGLAELAGAVLAEGDLQCRDGMWEAIEESVAGAYGLDAREREQIARSLRTTRGAAAGAARRQTRGGTC